MSTLLIIIPVAVLAALCGYLLGSLAARERLRQLQQSHDALRRDFDTVSAVNMQLLRRQTPEPDAAPDLKNTLQRFLDLYDEAKRCLHRALDRHNAVAARPIVIARDGSNILEALTELPPRAFSDDTRKDLGLRSWIYRILEMDMERRHRRQPPPPNQVLALERERELWDAVIKHCA